MRAVVAVALAAAALAACKPEPERNTWSLAEVQACQEAVIAGGFPGGTFEQVDVEPVPAGQVAVRGFVVVNGRRTPFTCAFDGKGGVGQVTITGQPR